MNERTPYLEWEYVVVFGLLKNETPRKPLVYEELMVGVKRLELPTSCSQSRRATNCATPRYCVY